MKRQTRQTLASICFAAATIGSAMNAINANANPVAGQFVNDSRGDAFADIMLNVEIGDANLFPIGDAILYHDHRANTPVGVADDGIANDWTVHMTNVTGVAFRDLFFVADVGATIGNADVAQPVGK